MKQTCIILCSILVIHLAYAQEQGIINNAKSPHVKLKSINIGDCQWTSGFWADKFKLCEEVMVPHMGSLLKGDIKMIEGHARIEEVRNQVAIKRGPVVYCVESPDLPDNTGILDVYVAEKAELTAQHRPEFLGGLTTIRANVLLRSSNREDMYHTVTKPVWKTIQTQFVPYYAWSNRGKSEMTVWMPIVWE
jgi:hypothetical protein